MTKKVAIVTDSVACLTRQQTEEYGIEIIPISFFAGGQIYRDWVDICPSEAYELFRKDPDSFMTSAPSPQECHEIFRKAAEKASSILCITVSRKLSRVYDSATAAIELVHAEFPEKTIEVIDSQQATSSEGMIALAAARAAEQGKGAEEAKAEAETVRNKVFTIAFLDTLEHVFRSGRIPKIASKVGSILNIKPVLTISGVVHFTTMVRSHNKGIERMLEMMRERVNGRPVRAAVTHAYAPEEAARLRDRVSKEFNCVEIWLSEFSPVMGYACGTGTVGLSFYAEEG